MKNYTSEVPVSVTVSRIENILAKNGAENILKEYRERELKCLSFILPYGAKKVPILFPADVDAVETVLISTKKRKLKKEAMDRIHAQAARTAWKIMQDWLEVQVTLIELQGIEPLQVFLPYVWDGKRTYYEKLKEGNFKLLGMGEG